MQLDQEALAAATAELREPLSSDWASERDLAAIAIETYLGALPKPQVIVIENPQEDPGYAVFGDVEVTTMSTFPWSKWASEDEARENTELYLGMLREERGTPAFREWLQPWLVEELGTRDRDFSVDWATLTIVETAAEEGTDD